MAITKTLRFEVFRRDGFRCAYCGQAPPTVILEIDHVNPKVNGGEDSVNNYLTACYSCNHGKKGKPLDKIPPQLIKNLEDMKKEEKQLYDYQKWIKKIERRERKATKTLNEIYEKHFPTWKFNDTGNEQISKFLKMLPLYEMETILKSSISKFAHSHSDAAFHFCAACWQKTEKIRNWSPTKKSFILYKELIRNK